MENKINKTEQQELKNKEFLKKIEDKNISNITFKAEGLGVLEFNLMMTGKDFKTIERPFRIERVSTDTRIYLHLLNISISIDITMTYY